MPLFDWVENLGKLFTHIAFPVFSVPRNWGTNYKREYSDWADLTV